MKTLIPLGLAALLALATDTSMAESIDAAKEALLHAEQNRPGLKTSEQQKLKPEQLERRRREQEQLGHDLQLHPHMAYNRMGNQQLHRKQVEGENRESHHGR